MKIGKNAHDIFAPTTVKAPLEVTAPAIVEKASTPKTATKKTETSEKPLRPVVTKPVVNKAPVVKVEEQSVSNGRGRPPLHQEPATKITTVLLNRHVVYLDGLSNEIRQQSGAVVKRSEILRALVEALESVKPDLGEVRSQDDLTELLRQRLK